MDWLPCSTTRMRYNRASSIRLEFVPSRARTPLQARSDFRLGSSSARYLVKLELEVPGSLELGSLTALPSSRLLPQPRRMFSLAIFPPSINRVHSSRRFSIVPRGNVLDHPSQGCSKEGNGLKSRRDRGSHRPVQSPLAIRLRLVQLMEDTW
jgi:hypothetical protein